METNYIYKYKAYDKVGEENISGYVMSKVKDLQLILSKLRENLSKDCEALDVHFVGKIEYQF